MMKYRALVSNFNSTADFADLFYKNFKNKLDRVKAGDIVLLKPNMFMTDKYFYTNPELLKNTAMVFKELGAKVVIAERLRVMDKILDDFSDIYKYADVISFDDMEMKKIKINDATSLRQEIEIPSAIFECDFLVGVPQFRTHAGVLMSNALKNMVGILPGFTTRIIHNVGLTESIVDINRIRQQDMVVADLTTTIEGNYPIDGFPVHRNTVIIADNALAADLTAAELAGFEANSIQYLILAAKAGMGPYNLNEVEVINDLEDYKFGCIKAGISEDKNSDIGTLYYESACPECKRYCHSLIEFLKKQGISNADLTFVSGPVIQEDISGKDPAEVVLVGNCTYHKRNSGIYIEGCPPRAIQAQAVGEWLQNGGTVCEQYANQCRWTNLRRGE